MRSLIPFLFLVSLPFFIAIGHDAYLFYEVPSDRFELSKVGYVFARYIPEQFNQAREMISPEHWKMLSLYILDQKTVIIAGVFAFGSFLVALLLKIFRLGPFKDVSVFSSSKLRKIDAILGEKKETKYQYKRK